MLRWLPVVLAASAVGGCAATEPPVEWRLLVTLRQPTDDPALAARIAGAATGLPARPIAAASPRLFAIALRCPDAAACGAALARLRADTVNVEHVETDERKRIVTP